MAYVIGDDCIACGTCIDECPSGAILRATSILSTQISAQSAVLVLMFVLMRQSVFHNLLWKDTFSYNKTLRAVPLESLFSFIV